MRYRSTVMSVTNRFDDGVRPPLELIPDKLANLIRERDRIGVQRGKAETHLRDLQQPHHDIAAQQADDTAATTAARAGKPIPAPEAVRRLEDDRAKATREYEAQVAAFTACTEEAARIAEDDLYAAMRETRHATLEKSRAKVEALAHKLADAVDAAVREDAVAEWLRSGSYQPEAETWQADILDLSSYGLTRHTTKRVNVRDAIVTAATTTLEPSDQ